MRQATSKSGYLDVKLPARARGVLRSWKAWKRRWVVLHGLHDLASGATVVTLDMYSSAHVEGQQLERTTIYLEGVTLLQRAVSRSHPYSFCAEARHTLVYLAAQCETESQDWMDVFRNILWPPVPISDIDKAYCEVYPVAVIDPAFSNLYAVKGGACHLLVSDRVLLFRCSHTGHPLLEWPPYALLKVCLANAPETRDRGKVLILQPGPECVGWSSPLHLFCPQAQDLVKHISMAMQRPPRGDVYSMGGTRIPFDFLETTESLGTSLEDLAAPELPDPLLPAALYDLPRPSLSSPTEEYLYQIPPKRISFSAAGGENRSTEGYYDRPREEAPVAALGHLPRGEVLQRQRSHSDSDISKVGVAKIAFGLCQAKSHTSLQSNEAEKSDATKTIPVIDPSSFLDKEANEEEKVVLRTEKQRNSQGPENALSICSSISSHDSGVQMCLYDEIVGAPRPVMDASKTPVYDQLPSEVKAVKFDSDVSEASSSTQTLRATESDTEKDDEKDDSCVTSESDDRSLADGSFSKSFETASIQSDGSGNTVNDMEMEQSLVCELYSEIGSNPSSPQKEGEPVYEDLDKYRKDIHKLLGIPHSAGQRLANGSSAGNPEEEAPPPLPPRRPRFTFLRKSAGRKKDVAAFLGIEDPMTQQVIRFQQEVVASTPAAATEGIRRKNLYRFLGVDQKIVSTLGSPEEKPTGKLQRRNSFQFGSNETQYDIPQGNLRKLTQSPVNKRGRENRPSRKISGTLLRIFKEKEGRNEDSSDSCSDSPMARRVYKPSRPRWSDPVEPHMELREKPSLPSSYYENRLPACPETENGHQTHVDLIPHTENSSDSSGSADNSPTAEDQLSSQSSALLNAANRLSDKVWSSLQELLTKQMEEKIVPHSKSVSDFRRRPSYETPLSGGSLASSFDGFVSISYLDQTNSEPLYLDMTPKLRERKMWDDIEEIDPNFLSPFPSTRERESMCIYQDMKYRQSIGSAADANIPPGLSLLIPQAGLTFQPKNVCDAETPASELSSLPWISVDDETTKQRPQNETNIEQESGVSVKIQDCSNESERQDICDITITFNAPPTSETVLLNNPTYSECLGLSNTATDLDKSITNNTVTTSEKSDKDSVQRLCENGQNTLQIHDKNCFSENIISCTEDDYQLGKNVINGKFSQGLCLQKTDNVNAADGTLSVINKCDSTETLSNKPLESLGLKIYGENWNRFFPQSDSESDWFQCLTYFDESAQSVHAAEDMHVVQTKNKSNLTEKKVQTGKPLNKQMPSELNQDSTQSKVNPETVNDSLLAFQERIARFNAGPATSSSSCGVDIANCATEFYPGKLREIVVSVDSEEQSRRKTPKTERTAASSSIPAKGDERASAIEGPSSSKSTDAVTLRRSGSSPSALARRKTYVSSAFLYIGNSEKDDATEPVRPASDNILGVSYGNYLL